jgi:hypothetical protein
MDISFSDEEKEMFIRKRNVHQKKKCPSEKEKSIRKRNVHQKNKCPSEKEIPIDFYFSDGHFFF